jgi:hypothetical protein
MALGNAPEFSKYYLMKTYLRMTDEEIQENVEGLKKDIELGFKQEEMPPGGEMGMGGEGVPEEGAPPEQAQEAPPEETEPVENGRDRLKRIINTKRNGQ